MERGIVFSIEEFALFDGPGIRTTVFLKGCPMRCVWCHSPEGQKFECEPIRSPNGCLSCLSCMEKGKEITGKPCLVEESVAVCPRHLVRMCGDSYSSDQLIERILKNESVLTNTGGGVTFSGGEPLAQFPFLLECLSSLRGRLHRAVQTSGYAASEAFSAMLMECDYVLYDLKLMDPVLHQRYCGQDNTLILENYRLLAASGKPFITRIPLIPQVNDTEDNLEATARFMQENSVKKVELLPYHKLAGSKYSMVGRTYAPPFDENRKPNVRLDIFEKFGIEGKQL